MSILVFIFHRHTSTVAMNDWFRCVLVKKKRFNANVAKQNPACPLGLVTTVLVCGECFEGRAVGFFSSLVDNTWSRSRSLVQSGDTFSCRQLPHIGSRKSNLKDKNVPSLVLRRAVIPRSSRGTLIWFIKVSLLCYRMLPAASCHSMEVSGWK